MARFRFLPYGNVSIHALLAECDLSPNDDTDDFFGFNPRTPCGVRLTKTVTREEKRSFNPRTPCGVRPPFPPGPQSPRMFQSTHSLRSATVCHCVTNYPATVSIHALLAECDNALYCLFFPDSEFQSTHSLRSATGRMTQEGRKCVVSIHALLAECDLLFYFIFPGFRVSIHALLAECDGSPPPY